MLKQAKNSKCIRFQSIPMAYKYSINIPELDEYFKREDELLLKNRLEESKRKVTSCKHRLEQLKIKISEQEQSSPIDILQQTPIVQKKQKDLNYYEYKMKSTINDSFRKKRQQADTFNQTLYFYVSNRDQSLEEKSDQLNTTIRRQGFLDETQQVLKKSLHQQIKASHEQKEKFIQLIKDISKRKESINISEKKRLLRLRNSIALAEYVKI